MQTQWSQMKTPLGPAGLFASLAADFGNRLSSAREQQKGSKRVDRATNTGVQCVDIKSKLVLPAPQLVAQKGVDLRIAGGERGVSGPRVGLLPRGRRQTRRAA